jgi:hypothetical protein
LQELCVQERSLLTKQNPVVSISGENARRLIKGTAASFFKSCDRTADFQLQRLPEVLGAYNTFVTNLEHSAKIQGPEPAEDDGQAADDGVATVEMTAEFRTEIRRIIIDSVRSAVDLAGLRGTTVTRGEQQVTKFLRVSIHAWKNM